MNIYCTLIRSAVVLLFVLIGAAFGQGTAADYERAEKVRGLTSGKVFKTRVEARWFGEGSAFWYRNELAEGKREFVLVDAAKATRAAAFDHKRLAEALAKKTGKKVEADKLPVEAIETMPKENALRLGASGKGWKVDLKTYELSEIDPPAVPKRDEGRRRGRRGGARRDSSSPRGDKSPDGHWVVFIKDHNLHLREAKGGKEFALTSDGTQEDHYSSRVSWSPDSKHFVSIKTRAAEKHTIYMIESSPKDQLQPKLHTMNYLKPGDRIASSKPHLFDVATKQELPLSDKLFSNPWRISGLHWFADSRRFSFLYNQRGHQVLRIVAVDAGTGEAAPLIDEVSKTFVDYSGKEFTRYLDKTHEIIWMSERDGWNHLYLFDSRTGQVKNQITKGPWIVRGVERVDEEQRQIWFRAAGVFPEQDPYYIHYARINFDGSGLTLLTDGNGTHSIRYSPDRRFLVDTYSRVDMPPVSELRRAEDGALVCELERADISALLATGWRPPERFVAKGRDGKTDIYGIIHRPMNFDPKKKYPVIEKIYAGPHGSFVPKRFGTYFSAQPLAEIGFVVVQIDGMGTSNRSKAFHDVCWKNLGDSGFPDRILWMKAAAKKYPAMDLSRVGIYGGSAGGQARCGPCWPSAISTRRRPPTAAVTITAWTKSGGTNCG